MQRELEALKAAERRTTEDAKLRGQHKNYRCAHGAFNHRSSALDAAISAGIPKDAARPPGFSCPACAHVDPSGAHFVRNTKVDSSGSLVPYRHVKLDLRAPFEVRGPNGFRYLFGGADRATGKIYLKPIRAKSAAKEAFRASLALIRAQYPGIELRLVSRSRTSRCLASQSFRATGAGRSRPLTESLSPSSTPCSMM